MPHAAGDPEALVLLAVDQDGGGGVLVRVNDDLHCRAVATELAEAADDEGVGQARENGLHVQEDPWRASAKALVSMSSTWLVPSRLFKNPRCRSSR